MLLQKNRSTTAQGQPHAVRTARVEQRLFHCNAVNMGDKVMTLLSNTRRVTKLRGSTACWQEATAIAGRSVGLALFVLLVATPNYSYAKPGGNGGGKPGGDPPPAVVNYAFQRVPLPADFEFGIPWPRNINTQGEIAGYYDSLGGNQPYYYDINSGASQLTNLNDLSLDSGFDVPDGWYIYAATDINNRGDISGALATSDGAEQLRGFVLELRPDDGVLPRLHTIPDEAWTRTYASRINDAGEVLGRGDASESYIYNAPVHGSAGDPNVSILPMAFDAFYAYLNNPVGNSPAQVLTSGGLLYTLGDAAATDLNLGARIDGFNDAGVISGSRQVAGKGKKTTETGYIYDGQFTDILSLRIAIDINNSGDVIGPAYKTNYRPTLVHATHGVIDLDLDGVVVFENDADQTLWESVSRHVWKVSERGILGTDPAVADFPVIVGSLHVPGGSAFADELFILQPVPVVVSSLSSIPEPSGFVLALLAGAGLLLRRRCTNKRMVS